jgi:peptidoglycan/LPS O-acetylase OafA/YrhL
MKISEFLNKEKNNLDLMRIILACLVIVGHSNALNGSGDYWIDPIEHFFEFTYSGALAVKLFFFISGLVVTNSYLSKKSPVYFIASRFFRIMPALLFVLLMTVFVFGPILTKYNVSDYWSQLNYYAYIRHNIIFYSNNLLPGVFHDNLYPNIVNGSLWTLRYEVGCYIVLLVLFMLLGNKNKYYFIVPIVLITIDALLPMKFKLFFTDDYPQKYLLPMCFSYGVLFAILKDKIKIDIFLVAIPILLFFLFKDTRYVEVIFIIASCNMLIYLASRKFVLKFKPKHDISYGIYLWGFLIQQSLFHFFGHIFIGFHCLIAIVVSIIFGLISFVYIERPFMKIGKNTIDYLSTTPIYRFPVRKF